MVHEWRSIDSVDSPSSAELDPMLQSLAVAWAPVQPASARLDWAMHLFDLKEDELTFADISESAAATAQSLRKLERAFEAVRSDWNSAEQLERREAIDNALARMHLIKQMLSYKVALDGESTIPRTMRPATGVEEAPKKTPFQRTILYVLEQLSLHGYRRVDDKCYVEVLTDPEQFHTHAYREKESIMDFVQRVCNKDESPDRWDDLFACRTGIGDDIVKQLQRGVDSEFPLLDPDRYTFSFRNGLYRADEHMFYAWETRARWASIAKHENDRRRNHRSDDGGASMLDTNLQEARAPTRNTVATKYFNTDFPVDLMGAGKDAPMPEIDMILRTQHLDNETMFWTYAFLGRLLYPVKHHDGWSRIMFVKGMAGSGKSTICNAVRQLYPPHLVGTVGHETTFMLSALHDKLLYICAEVRRDTPVFFQAHQNDFQSMITGEEINVAFKGKTARVVTWQSQGLLCGNQMFKVSDAGGSIHRRLLMINFDYAIKGDDLDPLLENKISDNIGAFLLKCNCAYLHAAQKHGRHDLLSTGVLPPQIHTFLRYAKNLVDSAARFIDERLQSRLILASDVSAPPTEVYMKWSEFTSAYTRFLDSNNLPKQQADRDHFSRVFSDYTIVYHDGELDYGDQARVNAKWVLGIGIMDNFPDLATRNQGIANLL